MWPPGTVTFHKCGSTVAHGKSPTLQHIPSSPGTLDRLMPLVYDELRLRARAYLSGEREGQTLQPTALVHIGRKIDTLSHWWIEY